MRRFPPNGRMACRTRESRTLPGRVRGDFSLITSIFLVRFEDGIVHFGAQISVLILRNISYEKN